MDNPDNDEYLEHYKNACEELKTGIIAHRDHYVTFDKVLDYTITMLINRDAMLKQQKKLTRTMIYYMYFRCDIGRNV